MAKPRASPARLGKVEKVMHEYKAWGAALREEGRAGGAFQETGDRHRAVGAEEGEVRVLVVAVLLSACAAPPSPKVTEWPCHDWQGSGDVKMITLEALAPPDFICLERICYGRTQGQQAGPCYYGCPDDRLPAYCEMYR